jgi:hypothetical protein
MRLSSTLLALAAVLAMTSAAQAATTSGSASATIVTPIAITAGTAMSFGNVTPPPTGDGTASSGGTVTPGVGQTGTPSHGTFNVTGQASATYDFSGSDSSVSLSGPGPAMTAALTYESDNGDTTVGALSAGGTDLLTATGVLTIPAGQVAGAYTGNYNVVVNYN